MPRYRDWETPATDNTAILEKIKDQPAITELYPEPSYEELKSQLSTYLGINEELSQEIEYKKPVEPQKQSVTKAEVEDAFDDLFN